MKEKEDKKLGGSLFATDRETDNQVKKDTDSGKRRHEIMELDSKKKKQMSQSQGKSTDRRNSGNSYDKKKGGASSFVKRSSATIPSKTKE